MGTDPRPVDLVVEQVSSPLEVLHALADSGHLTRETANFDAAGREIDFDERVGWFVIDGGHRAIKPLTKRVRFSSEWMEDA